MGTKSTFRPVTDRQLAIWLLAAGGPEARPEQGAGTLTGKLSAGPPEGPQHTPTHVPGLQTGRWAEGLLTIP